MFGGSTVYDIRLQYSLSGDNRTTTGLNNMAHAADRASRSTGGLRSSLMGIAAAAGGFGALRLGKSLLIDYNNEIQQMQIGLSTVIGSQLHVPFSKARAEADRLFESFQEMAKKSPATTKDYVEMANGIARAVTQAGLGTEDLREMTGAAVIASKAFGIRADMAALDVEQMLRGDVTVKDRMANALLGSQGLSKEKFNAMSQKDRNRVVKEALNQDSIKSAAEAFGNSFQGQISTLQDSLQITFGQVGLPLMQEITKEVKKWNSWIERNPQKIQAFVQDFGGALATGFGMVRDVVTFLVENRETLMTIAKAWLLFKGASFVGGGLLGMGQSIMGMAKSYRDAATTIGSSGMAVSNGFKGLLGVLGGPAGAINAISLMGAAAYGLYSWWKSEKDREEKRKKDFGVFDRGGAGRATDEYSQLRGMDLAKEAVKRGMTVGQFQGTEEGKAFMARQANLRESIGWVAKTGAQELIKEGLLEIKEEGGRTSLGQTEKFKEMLTSKEFGTDQGFQKAVKFLAAMEMAMKVNPDLVSELAAEAGKAPEATPEQLGLMGQGAKTEVNVKIEKIEVMSDDPDRFVYGAINAFEDIARNPTQASGTIRGIGE